MGKTRKKRERNICIEMVYKIRNKSFYMPRPTNPEQTQAIRTRTDHHSFLRMYQSYRNISRHCKQYFYGDKKLEEIFIMGLRSCFLIPIRSETLTDQIKHGGERRFADQIDRDFELVSHNQHPYQLFAYEISNKYLEEMNEEYETRKAGGKTLEDEMLEFADELVMAEKQ